MIRSMENMDAEKPNNKTVLVCIITCGVLVVFAPLFAFLTIYLWWNAEGKTQSLVIQAKSDLQMLELAIDSYRGVHGVDPSGYEELLEDKNGERFLDKVPLDPFTEKPYLWEIVDGRPSLVCYGADGKPGGEGLDLDFRSTDFDRREP